MNCLILDEAVTYKDGGVGRLRLNRPKAINALNLTMVREMIAALVAWRHDPQVKLIIIDHQEGRGFCAGGDVLSIANSAKGHGAAGQAFFFQEYRMNHLMYTYEKPGAVFMDGITMGGGVGISLPCKYRIVTERTRFAMPETGIGLFPDVGGGRYLSRLRGRVAQFLALTGAKLDGAECLALRLATHYISSESVDEVKARICADPDNVAAIFADASIAPPAARILENIEKIDRLFASDRLEDIIAALEADPSEWARKELAVLRTKSPISCKISLRLFVESPKLETFAEQMELEFGIVPRIFRHHDFLEGVNALLIDKTRAPRWMPATAEGVTDAMVDEFFRPLPQLEAWSPL